MTDRADDGCGEDTRRKHRGLREPWKKGESGNPKGRPKGSRNKLGEDFLAALYEDFEQHGPAAIVKMREEKPADYIKMVASIIPKELRVETSIDDLTDAELDGRIRQISRAIGLEIGSAVAGGDIEPDVPEDDSQVH